MHIPDGFLNGNVSGPMLAGAFGFLGHAFSRVRRSLKRRAKVKGLATFPPTDAGVETSNEFTKESRERMLRMATVGSLIFAFQMLNFPVAEGTSGHFLGGLFAVLVLGPWEGLLVIGVILAVQAVLFGDGGIVAFGANVFNMGVIAGLGGWYLFRGLRFIKSFYIRIAITAWLTVVCTAIAASVELSLSDTSSLSEVLRHMISVHALIGIGEAVLTVVAIAFLRKRKQHIYILQKDDA